MKSKDHHAYALPEDHHAKFHKIRCKRDVYAKQIKNGDKRIFRYLKGKPKLGLWYPRVSSFDLESYSDSDYAGANLDRKSTTGGCQFLGRRLISWQCKKQTIVATSTIEAEYVAAASCCGQVLWIQNQMLDYGFNFMNTKIYIDNESTICIVKNPVYHSKTKHIAIRHHFIRDAYEKKLIQVLKIHTDDNVADLLTKAFDVSRFHTPDTYIVHSLVDKVSTASANLVPLGKVCTALERLKKNTAKGTNTMAVLDSCPKHNMVAYLEKSEGNVEFHEIIDFLKRSSIHHALTVSPVVSTTFVEQFWTSAKSKTINNVRHITAKVAGKSVSISEASIRSDLLFDDADGIDTLPNQAIFDAIQQMGSKSTSWDQIPTNIATAVICLTSNQKYNFSKLIFDGKQLANVSVPLDHFPVNTLTSKDEGASSERLSDEQPSPSPAPTSEVPYVDNYTDSNLLLTYISEDCLIGHAKTPKNYAPSKKQRMHKSLNKIITWKQKGSSEEDKESSDETRRFDEVRLSTKDVDISTDGSKVSTDEQIEGTDEQVEGTEEHNEGTEEIFESTEEQREGTEEKVESTAGQTEGTEDQTKEEVATQASQTSSQTPTSMIFGDDETIATLLLNMSQEAKAALLKKKRKIDPKDKGKKKIEEEDESESEDDDIPQAVKKFKQLESDEARIEADRILAEKLQEQEREQFTIEERAKFLHDTIAAQRKFLAQQRTEAIRNRPPTKNQLRNQMMTYLKHVGNFKHSKLKSKKFEDIQAMYEKIKRSEEDFIARWEEDKGEENTRKRKHGTRKKMKSRKRRFKQDTSQDDPSDIEKENDY
ncbi:hypothetical protein Tco_0086823 [Tanacetum coccineum]